MNCSPAARRFLVFEEEEETGSGKKTETKTKKQKNAQHPPSLKLFSPVLSIKPKFSRAPSILSPCFCALSRSQEITREGELSCLFAFPTF
jgi:hypothetical protein